MNVTTVATSLLIAAFILSPLPAHCTDDEEEGFIHEIKLGVLAHDVDGLWSNFNRENGVDINCAVHFSPGLNIFGGKLRPAVGASVNTHGYTSKVYLDGIWQIDVTQHFFLGLGIGLAVHDGEKRLEKNDYKALGSGSLFHVPVEVGVRFNDSVSLSVYFDHVSNANMSRENEGLDTVGLRLGYSL